MVSAKISYQDNPWKQHLYIDSVGMEGVCGDADPYYTDNIGMPRQGLLSYE